MTHQRINYRVPSIAYLIALCLLLALPCCGEKEKSQEKGRSAGPEIAWQTSFASGMEAAKRENKTFMVDFYSNRCGWCKVLDQQTYRDPEVMKKAREFVSVKVDVDRNLDLAERYRIAGLPTILFLNKNGVVVHKVIGFRQPQPFLAEMDRALSKQLQFRVKG